MEVSLKRKSVCFDKDDHLIDVKSGKVCTEVLRNRFTSIYGEPKWAQICDDTNGGSEKTDDVDTDDEMLLKSCGFLDKSKSKQHLTANSIKYLKFTHLNASRNNEGLIVRRIKFNKHYQVALVSGNSTVAALYAVDGEKNECIHSINLENFPIYCASFHNQGNEIIFGSNRKHCIVYDMLTSKVRKIKLPAKSDILKKFKVSPDNKYIAMVGESSRIHLISGETKELIHTFKQNDDVHSLTFTPDNQYLITNSSNAQVSIWDLNKREFFHRWFDDGCIRGSVIDVSSSNQFVATGSCEGIVNLYEKSSVFKQSNPQPVKIFKNLNTRISSLLFNPTSELLCFASSEVPDAIKLANVASRQVFKNFHVQNNNYAKFHCVRDVDFSPSSGYMAVAKINPNVDLFRLLPYPNY